MIYFSALAQHLNNMPYAVIFILYAAYTMLLIIHIILNKEDVKAAAGWIGLVILSPLLGGLIYIVLGINRIKRKAHRMKQITYKKNISTIKKKIPPEIAAKLTPENISFINLSMHIHENLPVLGNSVEPLINGEQAYPVMIDLIKNAKKEVLLESYIFDYDSLFEQFFAAFKQASANGAKIKVLIDAIGVGTARYKMQKRLREIKNLETGIFLPPKFIVSLPFVNLRNHRKMLIADGKTAVFGGMNITKNSLVKTAPSKNAVQDITFKIEGGVIKQLSALFEADWHFASKKHFTPVEHAPEVKDVKSICRLISDGPDQSYSKIETLVTAMLGQAKHKIDIITPYFLPNETVLTAIEIASMKNVEVNVIIPKKTDIPGMDYAMSANYERLLSRNVNIYLNPMPFDHSKACVIDGAWTLIGSANWDERSFKLNFESCVECVSKDIAAEVEKYINSKKRISKKQMFKTYAKMSLHKRIRNNIFRLLTPYY
ncbi:Phospholipase D/transphosphatidylase [Elusimicrobium minutum Pei191]|uniref:Phospholipase D/transphosphatidylase n=1 Tax=Elusimicrobium minutum (strain Pei191) TaxID=445932 RepID=B2KD03_ELUMP|nr:phospholipase D-like domain-containing protein [Elusimicrobium minutum]ACC98399.1 Phospholipase D/transphosphatidylase [Elusimicrobium minutum Pei191]